MEAVPRDAFLPWKGGGENSKTVPAGTRGDGGLGAGTARGR